MFKKPLTQLPTPVEVGIDTRAIPNQERFDEGFKLALSGGQLRGGRNDFQYSHRMGFRAGKLFNKEERARRGYIDPPQSWKFKMKLQDK